VTPQVSVVVPVYNEGEVIVEYLDRLLSEVKIPCEVLVVFDSADDTTRPYLEKYATSRSTHRPASESLDIAFGV
jgi:glycosyltransferase involved in cell wall biosynthesis